VPGQQLAARGQGRRRCLSWIGVGHDYRAMGTEAGERLALLDGGSGDGGAHDWLVVTLLTPLLALEPELELDPVESEPLVV